MSQYPSVHFCVGWGKEEGGRKRQFTVRSSNSGGEELPDDDDEEEVKEKLQSLVEHFTWIKMNNCKNSWWGNVM